MKKNIAIRCFESSFIKFYQVKEISFLLFLLICCCFGSSSKVYAQMGAKESVGVVNGIVVDSISGQAMDYVTIALQHPRFNKVLNGASTDDKGRFRIEGLAAGAYRLRVSMVGYEEKTIENVEIKEDGVICELGTIKLSSGHQLTQIEVVGKRALIEQHFDKLVYNVSEDIGSGTQTLNDLLRKVPMVTVDAQGNVSLRGNTNFQLLIDGKPSGVFSSNKADALRAIPADQVERIEVITMPSARYDMEGAAGVINIITKHKKIKGYSASLNVSGGNYLNILNSNLNARGEVFGVRLQVGGTLIRPQTLGLNTSRIEKESLAAKRLEERGNMKIDRLAVNYLLGVDFDPNDFHSFSTTFKYNPSFVNRAKNVELSILSDVEHFFTMNQDSENDQKNQNLLWTTDYRKKFTNPDNQWTTSIQVANYKLESDYLVNQYLKGTTIMGEMANNLGNTNELTAQTDYIHAFSDNIKMEIGGKYLSREINSDADFFELYPDFNTYELALDRSFQLAYWQKISAAYIEADIKLKKNWTARVGGRIENTKNNIYVGRIENTQSYVNFSPTIAINHIKDASNFTLSYGRRITRPSLNHLNPFENRQDPMNWSKGNPNLRPELIDAVDFNFSRPFKNGFVNGDVYYHYTQDIIEKSIAFQMNDQTLASYQNIGNNHKWGANAYFSYNFNDDLNLKGGSMVNYYLLNSQTLTEVNNGISCTVFGMLSWKLKHELTLEAVYAFLGRTITAQGNSPSFSTYQATVRKEVLKKGAITLTLVNPFTPIVNFTQVIETPDIYQRTQVGVPLRMITIGFNYNFNKNMPVNDTDGKKSIENNDLKKEEKSKY